MQLQEARERIRVLEMEKEILKSDGLLRTGEPMRFAFIKENQRRWPVTRMCRVLSVSRAGFYAWRDRPRSLRQTRRVALIESIRRTHAECRGVYGSPRLTVELNARGIGVCENTVAKTMRQAGVTAKRPRRFVPKTTDACHRRPVAENLLDRRFTSALPDQKWAADITDVPTAQGWLYLAGVIDLCSRKVVGWAMAWHMKTELIADALEMALKNRSPSPGLLHHSDRGSQYASSEYRQILQAHGLVCSMSRRGDCYDNAAMESFWSTLKRECVDDQAYATHEEAMASVFEYIEVFYNRTRRHSALGYQSPDAFEAALN